MGLSKANSQNATIPKWKNKVRAKGNVVQEIICPKIEKHF